MSVLWHATARNMLKTMTMLIDAGANVNLPGEEVAPLFAADTVETYDLLLSRGANPNGPDNQTSFLALECFRAVGHTRLRPAKGARIFPIVRRLLDDDRTDVHLPMKVRINDVMSRVTPIGFLLLGTFGTDRTVAPEHRVQQEDVQPLLQLLLGDARLDINLPVGHPGGRTPLMVAVQRSPWAVPMLLRHSGMDITLTDDQGRTALNHLVQKQASDTPLPGDVFEELERQLAGTYELLGFISHMGSNTMCGHYVAHIKKEGRWAIYNDRKVAVSERPPLELGYMYLYKRSA